MFEQDYIMRLIKEMIRAILKLLFNMDTDNPIEEIVEEEAQQSTLNQLLCMVDDGNIDDAENLVYELTSDKNLTNLKTALLFYSYLNEKEDDFLQQHNFTRKEIQQGVQDLAARYELSEITEAFLE